jgi:ketosteroid isomerase-like protein
VVSVRDAETWQLVDERLNQLRRLPYAELRDRVGKEVEVEELDRSTGGFRRRTRVMTEGRYYVACIVREGQIVAGREFATRQEALEAASASA